MDIRNYESPQRLLDRSKGRFPIGVEYSLQRESAQPFR